MLLANNKKAFQGIELDRILFQKEAQTKGVMLPQLCFKVESQKVSIILPFLTGVLERTPEEI
jgi:hypothetical protein